MALRLTTAETGYGAQTMDAVVERLWSNPGTIEAPRAPLGPHPHEDSSDAIAHAIVRQSRWVIICPWCPSAQYAHSTDKRFFCVECGNAAVDSKWVSVEWPKDPEAIEGHLSLRPDPTTRNWEWDENVGDLAMENAEHGVSGLELP